MNIEITFTNASGLHWLPTHNCTAYTNASIAGEGAPCCGPATQVAQFTNSTTPDADYKFVGGWVFAKAAIGAGGDSLVVEVPASPTPLTWLRFQFDSQPLCVLANRGGLPTSLFVLPVPAPGAGVG